jgi:hypothetical protein
MGDSVVKETNIIFVGKEVAGLQHDRCGGCDEWHG